MDYEKIRMALFAAKGIGTTPKGVVVESKGFFPKKAAIPFAGP
jgi:hypothetical protein